MAAAKLGAVVTGTLVESTLAGEYNHHPLPLIAHAGLTKKISNHTSSHYYPPSSGSSQNPHGGYANHEAYTMEPSPYVPPTYHYSDKAHRALDKFNNAFESSR